MEDEFTNDNLENLVIKDKEYYGKKRKKYLCIIIPILSFIIIGIIAVIVLFVVDWGGKIVCLYKTTKDNENVILIHLDNSTDFSLTIDNNNYQQKNSHIFEKAGMHTVVFHFKYKLNSLENLFKEVNTVYLVVREFMFSRKFFLEFFKNFHLQF